MKRSPNWRSEELALALELYFAKDLAWLSKISDNTPEIITLSYILQNLDYHESPKPEKFRSVGSVRMKLSNFKAIDPRYGKSSLSNIGKTDRDMWKKYYSSYSDLKTVCKEIIDKHFRGDYTPEIIDYLSRITDVSQVDTKHAYKLSFEVKEIVSTFKVFCQQNNNPALVKACDDFLGILMDSSMLDMKAYEEHGGINQERLADNTKIGALVRTEMEKLFSEGRLSDKALEQLKSEEWCRKVFHIGHPLIKEIDPNMPVDLQRKDENGHLRYWKTIYRIDNHDYILCKEWFESNRKYFLSWLSSIIEDNVDDEACSEFVDILKYIQILDSKEVSISLASIKKQFPEYDRIDDLIDYLLEKGVLSQYQGSLRDLNVDDYELLYDMLHHPMKYVKGFRK